MKTNILTNGKTNPIPLQLHYNVLNVCKVGGDSLLGFEIYLVLQTQMCRC